MSHAHHEPRGDAVVFTWGLRYDSRQCSETTGDPFILSRSNPSFFLPLLSLSLSLSLPPPFSHCHSANDDGHGSRPARRRRRTSQRPFRAWHIQCVRAACVGSLRGTSFDLERGCVSGCFPLLNAVRIPRKPPSSHLDSISWIDAATNLGGEGKGSCPRALKSPHASDHPLVRQKKST